MFQNRVAAIAIVVLTLAGVASLVGTEENEGALSNAAQTLAEKAAASSDTGSFRPVAAPVRDSRQEQSAPRPDTGPAERAVEFADDESLIDTAQGFDPSPVSEDPAEGEVVAIVEDGGDAGAAVGSVPVPDDTADEGALLGP